MAYEYDHDCPFEAFITNLGKYNEGELVGEHQKNCKKYLNELESAQKMISVILMKNGSLVIMTVMLMGCMKSWENMKTWMNSIIWLPSSMSWMIMIITIFRRQCRSVIIQAALKM